MIKALFGRKSGRMEKGERKERVENGSIFW